MVNEWKIKEEICSTGRRIYERGFVAANDGNISYRISEHEVLCTPTMICKGHVKPDDICTVDLEGNQLAGRRKRTSEVLLHLELYKADPSLKAVVHCHPPHATAFAVAGIEIPTCILPEVEVFLGPVPTAVYETPGSKAFAETVRPFVGKANTIILKNHGTVSFSKTLELACWNTEILDSYCRILMLAKQLGNVDRISPQKVNELLDVKTNFGMDEDPRRLENADLCANTEFGRGYSASGTGAKGSNCSCGCGGTSGEKGGTKTPPVEALIQLVTNEVISALR
jgi:L-fuculose-phosphate aldolase